MRAVAAAAFDERWLRRCASWLLALWWQCALCVFVQLLASCDQKGHAKNYAPSPSGTEMHEAARMINWWDASIPECGDELFMVCNLKAWILKIRLQSWVEYFRMDIKISSNILEFNSLELWLIRKRILEQLNSDCIIIYFWLSQMYSHSHTNIFIDSL